MSFRVCIPTAGTGSRLGLLTRYLNKSLVNVGGRPALAHIIEQFPTDVEFVIPLGFKGNLVKEFLDLAYPDRTFFYTHVDPYEGAGSGLGLTLLSVKEHLRLPFIFISCDTLVKEPIPAPEDNWMGYTNNLELDISAYRTLELNEQRVIKVCEKQEGTNSRHKPYIGLAGIYDHQAFWLKMEHGGSEAIRIGEVFGFKALLEPCLKAHAFTWYDTGSPAALAIARAEFTEPDTPNILEKKNEAIWFVDHQVIKFSNDQSFIRNRARRVKYLEGFIPEITGVRDNMYAYRKVHGRVLSEIATLPLFEKLLAHSQTFWSKVPSNHPEAAVLASRCRCFYRDKTYSRIELFYKNYDHRDGTECINGEAMPSLTSLLDAIDWDCLSNAVPVRFHGDFHFENILFDADSERFYFLDWRQEFAGNLEIGDIYYDLAKLLHGLIISHEIIARDLYTVSWNRDAASIDFHRKQILVECEQFFLAWLSNNGLDPRKVGILTALVYLNIAGLHHRPYSFLLFFLGKQKLKRHLEARQ
ncbi:phosphotransferase [Pseudomonadota bacterium]